MSIHCITSVFVNYAMWFARFLIYYLMQLKNDEVTFLLQNSAMMLYIYPSVSADTWFQGAPIHTKICRHTSPLHIWWGIKNTVDILDLCISHPWIWATDCMLNFLIGLVGTRSYTIVITTRVRTCAHGYI